MDREGFDDPRRDELFELRRVFARVYKDIVTEPFPPWFGPRVEYEDQATAITNWEQRGIPGLLQTEAYTRAAVRACRPYMPPEALEQRVRARLERQDILVRERPPKLWVIVDEGVLRRLVGGREVMAGQLDHLVVMPESSRVVVQVLPFGVADAPGSNGPAALFEFESQPPVTYLEGWESGQVVEDSHEVAEIATALSIIKGCALSPVDSRQLIADIRG